MKSRAKLTASRGERVSQMPDYEPASIALECIRGGQTGCILNLPIVTEMLDAEVVI